MYLSKQLNKKSKRLFFLISIFSVCALLSCRFGSSSNTANTPTETSTQIATETLTATMTLSPTPVGTPTLDLKSIWRKSRIAFASNRGGSFQIYLMRPDGSEVTQLTYSEGENHSPAWSQDGRKIAFVSTRDGNSEIYIMNPDGTEQLNISNNNSDDYTPVWLPKNRLAFISDRHGGETIYIMEMNGTKVETLLGTRLSPPARFICMNWIGEGTISYTFEEDLKRQIRLLDIEDFHISLLDIFENEFSRSCPIWSPTSEINPWMVFVSDQSGEDEIYKFNFKTKEELQVTFDSSGSLGVSRSMNAASDNWIVFYSKRTGNWDIFTAQINGIGSGGQWNITNDPADDIQPAWEPY